MRYSVFYRIQNRYKFFDRFCKRYIKIADASLYESMVNTNEELMELIVKMILDNDTSSMEKRITYNCNIGNIYNKLLNEEDENEKAINKGNNLLINKE